MHKYVPSFGDGKDKKYGKNGLVEDQLCVECGINGQMFLANVFEPNEKLDGLHFEIADWHAGNRFYRYVLIFAG